MLASRLQQAIGAERRIAGHARSIGTSIGISVGTSGLKTAETIMREADVAMYVAKSKGKAGHSVFDPHTHDVVVRTMGLQGDLEHAIRAHQFELNYQPIVSLASGELAGVEALVRWRHPTRGLLQPRDFIHLAELTGAIGSLDRWVLKEAGRQARAWGADGATGGNRFLSVNLSPVALVQPGFVTFVPRCPGRLRPARRAADPRSDRDRAAGPAWRCHRPHRAQGARRAAGDRRLRHGLRIGQPAARQPVRRDQDRREPGPRDADRSRAPPPS